MRTMGLLTIFVSACAMEVDTETSTLKVEYKGETYWFCGKGCMLEFQDDPEKYLDPSYEKSM